MNGTFIKRNIIGLSHITLFLIIYLSNLSYVTFGIITLSTNASVASQCKNVWTYDLIGIIYASTYIGKGAHTFITSFKKSTTINDMTDINDSTYIDYAMLPTLLIWGIYIVSTISGDCLQLYFHNGHKDVWDLCQGTFYGIVTMIGAFICLEFATCYFNKVNAYSAIKNHIILDALITEPFEKQFDGSSLGDVVEI